MKVRGATQEEGGGAGRRRETAVTTIAGILPEPRMPANRRNLKSGFEAKTRRVEVTRVPGYLIEINIALRIQIPPLISLGCRSTNSRLLCARSP
ncbi:protein of unknown function [Cupriavidus taiwanensis]|uniref:Uncharacterized protein n=1 Tax=Cupriavidus taiwanensis TaxID=164546 RepID=A0A375I7R9_9BURK|nr:protein of unknown function [Cupriavidus taiwanensis]